MTTAAALVGAANPAGAVRRSFPAGWVNPAGTAQFEDWDFGRCSSTYSRSAPHIGADSQGFKTGSVRAIAGGTVRQVVSWGSAWGTAIAIEHRTASGGRFLGVYGHVNPAAGISAGTTVSAGQAIATLYNLGSNKHLHLGVRPLGASEDASRAPVRGTGTCTDRRGYVDPLPWLAGQRPAGTSSPTPPAPAGRWATVRTWSAPWTVRTRTGPSSAYAQNGRYADGERVLVVCQFRSGQAVTDYYGPSRRTITWRVWNRSSTNQVWPDLYSDLPANPGLPSC